MSTHTLRDVKSSEMLVHDNTKFCVIIFSDTKGLVKVPNKEIRKSMLQKSTVLYYTHFL